MSRRVVITGLGPVSAAGVGIAPTWETLTSGRPTVTPIERFDPSGFDCRIAAQAPSDFKITNYVPKTYRKATKVMARDIEFAVAAADQAARDAGIITRGTAPSGDDKPSYNPARVGCQIGAGLIACELDELTAALIEACDDNGQFNIHTWGESGMNHLTPLWLLKYLPNMLACHVTIIHDTQGPSNTITCAEASGLLSIGEALRVIQRDHADMSFCGGADSKLNPMGYLRQNMTGLLNNNCNDKAEDAVRPFSKSAQGMVVGEGGGIVILESLDTFRARNPEARAYAEIAGFGASQSVHRESRNAQPYPQGRSIAIAARAAMREANVTPEDIDMIVPFGVGAPAFDAAEVNAFKSVFGERLPQIPIRSTKAWFGNCAAGTGALDVCAAAMAIRKQQVPASINCDDPYEGINAQTAPAREQKIGHVLVISSSAGGQNAALVLRKVEE